MVEVEEAVVIQRLPASGFRPLDKLETTLSKVEGRLPDKCHVPVADPQPAIRDAPHALFTCGRVKYSARSEAF